MGESGSGKSTTGLALLRLINSQGSIIFDGQPLQNLNRRQLLPIRHRIQVVFQDPNSSLNPRLNVLQIIEEGLRVHQPTLSAAQREQQVIAVMHEVGLILKHATVIRRSSLVVSDNVLRLPGH